MALGERQAVGLDPSAARPGSGAPAGAVLYEVIRTHAATGRTQTHLWGLNRETAVAAVASLNRQAAADGGRTLATSGHREPGWVYLVRDPRDPGGRR